MSLVLSKEEISKILQKRKLIKSSNELLLYLNRCSDIFLKISHNISNRNNISNQNNINPLLWQYGHVIFFYINNVLKNLNDYRLYNKYHNYIDFYDSFKTPLKYRSGKLLLTHKKCLKIYKNVVNTLRYYILNNKINNINSYLIILGIIHNDMHIEAFIFTKLNLYNKLEYVTIKSNKFNKSNIIKNIEFVDYNSSNFTQGSLDNKHYLIFDNEMPSFNTYIKKFSISNYPITEYLYLQFIKNNGYKNKKYWCDNGYKWLKEHNIKLPLYWINDNNTYYKIINNKKYNINTNLPIINISYYEAKAYCKWKKVRLPTETEYEYVSTNEGRTKFPWGNKIDINKCNINYNNFIKPVNSYKNGRNYKDIYQLIGNVWEWCEEEIYPYNGFKIDPVYREMSYPFFGFKKICKGGSFGVPDYLIHPKYRNAQYPDCRIQFIGFRVCK